MPTDNFKTQTDNTPDPHLTVALAIQRATTDPASQEEAQKKLNALNAVRDANLTIGLNVATHCMETLHSATKKLSEVLDEFAELPNIARRAGRFIHAGHPESARDDSVNDFEKIAENIGQLRRALREQHAGLWEQTESLRQQIGFEPFESAPTGAGDNEASA